MPVRLLDYRLPRRILTFGLLLIGTTVTLVFLPIVLLGAYLLDVIGSDARRPRSRFILLIAGSLAVESVALIGCFLTWISTGFGLFRHRRWVWHRHRKLMGWYTNTLLSIVVRSLGTHIEWRDTADLSTGPVVFVARHTSFFDALIPATVICHHNRLLGHHVVTQELRFSPCIDVVGHRFPNRFINRTPREGGEELPSINALGGWLDERSACVIFPEGTFRNPQRFERSLNYLREHTPEVAERAQHLRHVLPPRPSGTFALLSGSPGADVVICTNTGLEGFGSIKSIREAPVADGPIIVQTWRIDRSTIPEGRDEFDEWLLSQFEEIDAWVQSELAPPLNHLSDSENRTNSGADFST